MWACKLCHVSFTFESVEQHVYNNHLRTHIGGGGVRRFRVYTCGECMIEEDFEGFEDFARHCISRGHEPTRVIKGQDYDSYESQLFIALEEAMCLTNEQSSAVLDVSSASTDSFRTLIPSEPNQASHVIDIDWVEQPSNNERTADSDIPSSVQPLLNDHIPAYSELIETENKDEMDKMEPEPVVHQTSTVNTPDERVLETLSNDQASESETGITAPKRARTKTAIIRNALYAANSISGPSPVVVVVSNKRKKKVYPCAYCPKTSNTSRWAKYHERTHTGEKPYQCQTCGNSFARKHVLADHERTHTGEKPFDCAHCGKAFGHRNTLKHHTQKVHKEPV